MIRNEEVVQETYLTQLIRGAAQSPGLAISSPPEVTRQVVRKAAGWAVGDGWMGGGDGRWRMERWAVGDSGMDGQWGMEG